MGSDFVRELLTIVGIPGALVAAWRAIEELKNGNRERAKATHEKSRENRHKQATAARDALSEIFNSAKARAAMQMLDWSGRSYFDGQVEHRILFSDLGTALRVQSLSFDAKERFIRDCFEDFFDHLELVQHYIEIEFIHFDDVAVPLSYYAGKIVGNMKAFEPFLDSYGYPRAKRFLKAASEASAA